MAEKNHNSNVGVGLSPRELILKYCQVVAEPGVPGCLIKYGAHKYRSTIPFEKLTDEQIQRIYSARELKIKEYIDKCREKENKKPKASGTPRVVRLEPAPCLCGCGGVARAGRRFLPGHDAKLKSALRKQAHEGDKSAERRLKELGWWS